MAPFIKLKKNISLLAMATFGAVSIAFASVAESPLQQAWKETDFTLKATHETLINNDNCRTNELRFTACVNAFAEVFSRSTVWIFDETNPVKWIVPNAFYAANRSWFSGRAEQVDDFTITDVAPIGEDLNAYVTRRNAVLLATNEAFHSTSSRLDFDALIKRVPADAPTAALLANAYLRVAVDPHTYMVPSHAIFNGVQQMGIRATIQETKNGIYLTPFEEAAASATGIRLGDILETINGVSVNGQSLMRILRRLNGDPGSVKIKVRRDGESRELVVARERLSRPNITSSVVTDDARKFGVVKVRAFFKGSCLDLKPKLRLLLDNGVEGLVLDLRGNPGGYSDEAICMASLFLDDGMPIVKMEKKDWDRTSGTPMTKLPLTVITDNLTGSAAEILAGSLQEWSRAWVVGQRTYGKGTSQSVVSLPMYRNVSRAETDGLYFFKSWRSPQLIGVVPDFEAFRSPTITEESARLLDREEALIRPVLAAAQYYDRPTNIAELRQTRRCVQNSNRGKKKYQQNYDAGRPTDWPMLSALEVLSCQRENLGVKMSREQAAVLSTKNCVAAQSYFSSVEKRLAQAAVMIEKERIKRSADSRYVTSLEFYRTQRQIAELDLSDELAVGLTELNSIASMCGVRFRIQPQH